MSKIKNGGLDQYVKCKALTGSAVKGLTDNPIFNQSISLWGLSDTSPPLVTWATPSSCWEVNV